MRTLPEKLYLRRGEVRDYLSLSDKAMTKLVRAGALKPVYLPGMTWAFYERSQVERLKAAEKTISTQNRQPHSHSQP